MNPDLLSKKIFVGLTYNRQGFSLVEVVLALGIVGFALLAIFALFGNTMRSASETVSQNEVLGITRSFSDFLGSSSAGYSAVSNWVSSGSNPGIFAFVATNGMVNIGLSNNSTFANAAETLAGRGRLFRLFPTLLTNVPGNTSNVPNINSANDLADNAFIPVRVKIYAVPSVSASTNITNNLVPVFTYETSVFR